MDTQLGYWYCLNQVKGLGPLRIKTLLLLFNNPEEIYKLSKEQLLCIKGIDEKIAYSFIESKSKLDRCFDFMNAQKQKALSLNTKIITLNDTNYPKILKETNVCPALLYVKGNLNILLNLDKTICIVGTRGVSNYGESVSFSLSKQLVSAGWVIVSGMAKGTDLSAHLGALEAGNTIAVLGCGVDVIYPQEAKNIYNQILQKGLVISEYPFGTKPNEINLKKRNKITVGLSKAVVVIETSEKGGTMNAVRAALEQKKKIFVLEPRDRSNINVSGNLKIVNEGSGIPITANDAFSTITKELS